MSSRVNSITGTGSICDLTMWMTTRSPLVVDIALIAISVEYHGAVFEVPRQERPTEGGRVALRLVGQQGPAFFQDRPGAKPAGHGTSSMSPFFSAIS